MKSITLTTIASLVAAVSATKEISVQLDVANNSQVRAIVSNIGSDAITVITRDGLLSKAPIQKVDVSSQNGNIPFRGPRILFNNENLDDIEFETIAPGQSIDRTFDIAEWFDLSEGGNFDIRSVGNIQYIQEGSIESIPFISNTVQAAISGHEASQVHAAIMAKQDALVRRATIDKDCTGAKRTAVSKSIKNTVELATAGAKAARDGPASRLNKIFRRSDQQARKIVAEVFDKTIKFYNSETSGIPANHCSDVGGLCAQYGATAYCLPEKSIVGFCDPWFRYPEVDKGCSKHDQGVIAMHEATHLNEVKGTIDNEGSSDNLNHADSYAKFAHQALFNCPS